MTMTFPEALSKVFNARQRVTRRKWANVSVFVGLEQEQLCIKGHPADGLWHPLILTSEDYYATDWEVVE